jgi:hypothetical protein
LPGIAVWPAASFSVLDADVDPLRLAGVKDAVTPVGRAGAVKLTVELNPFDGTESKDTLAFTPMTSVTDSVDEASVNVGVGTEMVSAAVFVTPPPVAMMVIAWLPAAAGSPTVSVSMLVPATAPLSAAGEKEAVTPVGRPATVKLTVELNPSDGVNKTGTIAFLPTMIVGDAAGALRVKVGVGIITLSGAVFTTPPPVPVIAAA